MTVQEIVKQYLEANGFDGLYQAGECSCPVDALMPCDELCADCAAGHKLPCNPETCNADGDCGFHIGLKHGGAEVTLTLRGSIPCKKSKYRRSRRGLFLDRNTSDTIRGLILQVQAQWKREPVEHPEVIVRFWWRSLRADRDGKLATILDVLQKARVIRNDNAAHFNGRLVLEPVRLDTEERAEVEIREAGASSGSTSRKSASALIAKIPLKLARHIAQVFKPPEGI